MSAQQVTGVYHPDLLEHCSLGADEEDAQNRAKSYMDNIGMSGDFVIEGVATGVMGENIHYCLVAYSLRKSDSA